MALLRAKLSLTTKRITSKSSFSAKVTVRCGVSQLEITGPYFFDEGGGGGDSECYVKMLHYILRSQVEDIGVNIVSTT